MKKTVKRLLAPALALFLLCACMPLCAQAAVQYGDNVYQRYDIETAAIVFYGSGPTYDFDPSTEVSYETYPRVVIEPGVSYLGAYLFENASIGELVMPDAPITVNDDAFRSCVIEHITFPQTAASAAQYDFGNDPYDFGGAQVYELDLGGLDGFPNCFRFGYGDNYDLRSLCVGTNTKTIPENACNCFGALESLTLPDGLLEICSGAFESCDLLREVRIPDSVTTIGDYAFDYCTSLVSVTLPSHLSTIGDWAFCCTGLTSVTFPYGVTRIGVCAFEQCESLTEISLPNSIRRIEESAFSGTGLQSVHLPAGLQVIDASAFGTSLAFVCCDTDDCPVIRQYAANAQVGFRVCDGHGAQKPVAGDSDGDGEITLKDTVLMRRFLADGWNVSIDAEASDVDGDGSVTLQDVALISRYLAGGWDIEL